MGKSLPSFMLLLWLWNPVWAAGQVFFADPHLKAVVEQELWISDPTPEDMLGLTSLAAEARGITDLTGLEHATNLERLWIRWNQISNLSPLSGLTNLKFLDGHGNDLISDISPLAGLTNIETLILRYNRITGISALSGMTNLAHLHLEWNNITDVSALSGLTNLQEVSLQYNQFSDISALAGLTGLSSLDLRGNPLNTEACSVYIPQIIASNPGIDVKRNSCAQRRLVLSSTPGGCITDPGEGEFLYDNGALVFLNAQADPGFVFVGFSGTYATSDNPVSLTIEQDHRIVANFAHSQDPRPGNDDLEEPRDEPRVIHVDDNAPNDPGPRNPGISDRRENGTSEHPFDQIQEGIDVAADGMIVFVHAGTYRERIDLLGKRILLTGIDPADANAPQWPVIDGGETGPVVNFAHKEGPECVLLGFVITGGRGDHAVGIRCDTGSPTISNCLIAGNRAGSPDAAIMYCADSNAVFVNCTMADNCAGAKHAGLYLRDSHVVVSNSILWSNSPREVLCNGDSEISISHSDICGGWPGPGNLRVDPLFVAAGGWVDDDHPDVTVKPDEPGATWVMGDYHLRSQAGRWDSRARRWLSDGITSPCIDAGDPGSPVGRESYPNGHIINMGAYGGTIEASRTVGEATILGVDYGW